MDITTYTMILTTKLSALAFCYKDGGEKDENLLPEQKERKVSKMPSPFELMSYVFFTGGCMCGPFFEYSDYINFIERKGIYTSMPGSIIPSLVRLSHGLGKLSSLYNLHSVYGFKCFPWNVLLCIILRNTRIRCYEFWSKGNLMKLMID